MAEFKRQDKKVYKKIKDSWRIPKGKQSKQRRRKGGSGRIPNSGYGSPKSERGKINGKIPIMVKSISDIEKLTEENIVIFSSTLSMKKINQINEKIDKKIEIFNKNKIKNAEKRKNQIEYNKKQVKK